MNPKHHPGDDLLMSYAAGSMDEPLALVIATHLALCPRCRAEVKRLEALGGVMLEQQDAAPLDEGGIDRILARLDEPEDNAPQAAPETHGDVDMRVPRPLRDYLNGDIEQLDWKSFRGLQKVELLTEADGFHTRLMRIKPGTAMPVHTHEGTELTLVLAGGFSDETGHFVRGDVAECDASVEHRPIADEGEDCLCLAVTDAPLRLTGPVGRLLNPFLDI